MEDYGFALTPVSWRKENLKYRLKLRDKLVSGEETFKMYDTGEEGVRQLSAIFGLDDFVTNVNLPNRSQIPNLPLGAIVETNARFCSGSVTPVFAGNIPKELKALIDKTVDIQELIIEAAFERDLDKAFIAFISALYLGAEYAAYVIGYSVSALSAVFKSKEASLFVAIVKKYASGCAFTLGALVFFGIIGGMEAGTISPLPGFIICCVMFAIAFAGLNSRK